jgi:hypothetical protein
MAATRELRSVLYCARSVARVAKVESVAASLCIVEETFKLLVRNAKVIAPSETPAGIAGGVLICSPVKTFEVESVLPSSCITCKFTVSAVNVPVPVLRNGGTIIWTVVEVAANAGTLIGGPADSGINKTEMAAFAGSNPVPVIVSCARGSTVVSLSELISTVDAADVTVTVAESDSVSSSVLVAVTVTGLVAGTVLGAV